VGGVASDADTLHTHAGKVSSTRTITAGDGLTGGGDLSANRTVSALADATGGANLAKAVSVTANGLAVKVDGTSIQGSGSDQLEIKDGGVSVAKAAAAVQDLMPNALVTAAAEVANVRAITIQTRDAANNALAAHEKVRVWIATADYGAPDATNNTFGLTTGTQLRELTANADYEVISDAGGMVVFDLTVAATASRYVLAEIDGRIYSSGELAFD
jgi:hypothetical protein